VWSAGGDLLLYIERADQASSTLKAYSVPGNQSSLLVSSRPGERIGDPRLSRDGRSLIYSIRRETRSERQWEIRQRSLPAGEERTIYSESGRFRLHNLGWLGESVLAVKQYFPLRAGVNTGPVEILRLEPGGSRRTIQKFDLAYGHTAVLDADRGVLYLTVIEDGLSNIRAFFPATGRSIRLTDNQRREMTFAGLQVCGAGRLLYSHHGVISDLYLLERRH
jgi:hypothetical protein